MFGGLGECLEEWRRIPNYLSAIWLRMSGHLVPAVAVPLVHICVEGQRAKRSWVLAAGSLGQIDARRVDGLVGQRWCETLLDVSALSLHLGSAKNAEQRHIRFARRDRGLSSKVRQWREWLVIVVVHNNRRSSANALSSSPRLRLVQTWNYRLCDSRSLRGG